MYTGGEGQQSYRRGRGRRRRSRPSVHAGNGVIYSEYNDDSGDDTSQKEVGMRWGSVVLQRHQVQTVPATARITSG